MEEAPKGTFEDELEWCIRQLETGLLRRNPTPRQVEDTQRVLRVLRSQKAPFVKKRQVMNQVFGNYRLKMAEERRVQEQAVNNPREPKIQEVMARDSQSVAYRKSAKDAQSGAGHWFTPSGSGFNFNFFPDREDQNVGGRLEDDLEDHARKVKNTEPPVSQQNLALCLVGGAEFTFNFQITEETCSTSESSTSPLTSHEGDGDHLGATHMTVETVPESSSQKCSNVDIAASTPGGSTNRTQIGEAEERGTADSPKKRKKKKSKSKNTEAQSKVKEPVNSSEPLKEEAKSGDDELRRELDWCVEQLESGLQHQKSTPKQVEEVVRAIKTLRSAKVPLVKKRQVMRVMFGDYRRKMEEERVKQLRLMQAAKSTKMTEVTMTVRQNRSKVFRKSIHKSPMSAAPSPAAPAHTQGTSDQYTAQSSSSGQQEFTFRPSQMSFSFNFF
ncbi:UPF0488 protein C8orf33 homolog isoform X2 [Phyllobates terribilis]|uniref:UPF0488 protein C8orf33 homolog isoform X2 n=1 Tax=Phyllobates terribilis TaxID=111132 RepID=UPI003CCB1BBF